MKFLQASLFVLAIPYVLAAQIGPCTPLTAQERGSVVDIDSNGNQSVRESTEGVFLRDASGNTLVTRWATGAGNPNAPTIGYYVDRLQGLNYKLTYAVAEARLLGPLTKRDCRTPRRRTATEQVTSERRQISGLSCAKVLLESYSRDGHVVETVAWWAVDHDLDVRYETNDRRLDGSTLRIVTELSDIQLGVILNGSEVGLPSHFRIISGPRSEDRGANPR